jgi:hypothetical protein
MKSKKQEIRDLFEDLFKVSFGPNGKRPKKLTEGVFFDFKFGDFSIRYGYMIKEDGKDLSFEVDYENPTTHEFSHNWPLSWGEKKQGVKFITDHLNLKKFKKVLKSEIKRRKFKNDEEKFKVEERFLVEL